MVDMAKVFKQMGWSLFLCHRHCWRVAGLPGLRGWALPCLWQRRVEKHAGSQQMPPKRKESLGLAGAVCSSKTYPSDKSFLFLWETGRDF